MSYLSGLAGVSPKGRFTNGYVWSDHISAKVASSFIINQLEEKPYMDDTGLSDAIINGEPDVLDVIKNSYHLDNDKVISFQGETWLRSYCAGGLSAYDYSWTFTFNIMVFFTRFVVSTLAQMRNQLFNYDLKNNISHEHKAETLVTEWSGANDLVTVNTKPTFAEVDKAIAARIDNVKKLIASGYRNIILVNLPNLSLTPRFQAVSKAEQENAQKCAYYLNDELQKACVALSEDYPHCSIESFDINTMFEAIYHNPEHYGFEQKKLTTPYSTSKDLDNPRDGISPSTGYMFYDELHPSADMHALLAAHFYDHLESHYEVLKPNQPKANQHRNLSEEALLRAFRTHYEKQLKSDQCSLFGFARSHLNYKEADLATIFRHGLKEQGHRTLSVLKHMGWINQQGQLALNEPVLKEAMDRVNESKHLELLRG
jgi:phospholipase/lecithinase/hemolysin